MHFAICALAVLGQGLPAPASAAEQPGLAPLFGDHMVLQRDQPIRVWGTAAAGQAVTVSMAGSTVDARSGDDGQWALELPAMPAGGPHELVLKAGDAKVQLVQDVLLGDVFLC
jgi:sialate O-acetylesterase